MGPSSPASFQSFSLSFTVSMFMMKCCGSLYLSFFEFIKLFVYADFLLSMFWKVFSLIPSIFFFLLYLSPGLCYSYCVYVVHSVVVVQSLSHAPLFATPWTAGCQASLSFTTSQSLQKLLSISSSVPYFSESPFISLHSCFSLFFRLHNILYYTILYLYNLQIV